MHQQIRNFHNALESGRDTCQFASYVVRRLAAIGTVYVAFFGAFLLLAFAWRGEKEGNEPALNLFSYFNEAVFDQVMSFNVQCSIAVILILMCQSLRRKNWMLNVIGTLFVTILVLPPVWLNGDPQTRILSHFLYAVILLAVGLIFDRTFGYTRSLARRDFYLARLTVVALKPDGDERTAELQKLFESYAVDKYRDHIGDTFFTLDVLKSKAGAN